jgi:hypothetical protein
LIALLVRGAVLRNVGFVGGQLPTVGCCWLIAKGSETRDVDTMRGRKKLL